MKLMMIPTSCTRYRYTGSALFTTLFFVLPPFVAGVCGLASALPQWAERDNVPETTLRHVPSQPSRYGQQNPPPISDVARVPALPTPHLRCLEEDPG